MSGPEYAVAGKWVVFAFGLPDHASDGQPITGDAANITANVRIDGGAANAVDDVNPTELEDGYYVFDITGTEYTGTQISIMPASATANVQVIGCPATVFPVAQYTNKLGIASDGDLVKVNESAAATLADGAQGGSSTVLTLQNVVVSGAATGVSISGTTAGLHIDGGTTGIGFDLNGGSSSGVALDIDTAGGDAVTIDAASGKGIDITASAAALYLSGSDGLWANKITLSGNEVGGVFEIDNIGGPAIDWRGTTYGAYIEGTAGPGMTLVGSSGTDDLVADITGNITGTLSTGLSAAAVTRMDLLYGTDAGFGAAYVGPRGPGVYLDDAAGNTNTVNGTDGTWKTPVSTIAAAKTLADSLGFKRIYLVNDADIALGATMVDYEFVGIGELTANVINLTSQDVSASCFYNLCLEGVQGGSGRLYAEGCALKDPGAGATTLHIYASRCGIVDEIEVDTSADNVFDQCYSLVAGNSSPVIVATGAAGTISWRHGSGGAEFKSLSASHNVSYEADGQVIFNADCNVNATIALRGNMSITDNTAGMNNITKDAVLNQERLQTAADAALVAMHLDHLLAVDYDPASKPGVATALLNELIEDDGGVSRYTTNALENGPGGSSTDYMLLKSTTIATLADQLTFTLTDGSTDDNAYLPAFVIVTDQSDSDQKCLGIIDTYTGSTKGITLVGDPAIFTMATGDTVDVMAMDPRLDVLYNNVTVGITYDTFTITVSAVPLNNVAIWVTTDEAGALVVQSGTTDASGQKDFHLADANYWVHCLLSGYDFTSMPREFTVASGSFSWA